MSGHTITPYIDGEDVYARFECHEPEGAMCRLQDEGDCESWTVCDCRPSPEDERDHPDGTHCGRGHRLLPSDTCNAVEWLTAFEWTELHDAREQVLRPGPVVVEWSGEFDSYVWRYPPGGES